MHTLSGSLADEAFIDRILDEQLAVNVRTVILLTSKSLPLLKAAVQERKSAQVVNIASNAGKRGEATLASYSATKFAVVGFTESLHDELSTSGITATAICPGLSTLRWPTTIATPSPPGR